MSAVPLFYKHINPDTDHTVNRPSMVIVHGLFGSHTNWRTMSERLAQHGLHVVCVDLRNHGLSPHTASCTYEEMAEDLKEIIVQQTTPPVVIMGHSMGGKVSMACALAFPEIADGLIICDIAPVQYPDTVSGNIIKMKQICNSMIKSRRDAKTMLEQAGVAPANIAFFMQNLIATDETYKWRFNLTGLSDSIERLRSFPDNLISGPPFTKPAYFIRGEYTHDDPEPPEQRFPGIQEKDIRIIKTAFPDSTIDTIPNSGHWVHIHKPDEFYQCVVNWMNLHFPDYAT